MTHDELVIKVIKMSEDDTLNWKFYPALRAVLDLHQPRDITLPDGSWGENCCVCNNGWSYPCRTIQVIEKELNGDKKDS
jgi:hypothetical protein